MTLRDFKYFWKAFTVSKDTVDELIRDYQREKAHLSFSLLETENGRQDSRLLERIQRIDEKIAQLKSKYRKASNKKPDTEEVLENKIPTDKMSVAETTEDYSLAEPESEREGQGDDIHNKTRKSTDFGPAVSAKIEELYFKGLSVQEIARRLALKASDVSNFVVDNLEGAEKMGTEAAGPVPNSLLARQDLEGKKKEKSDKYGGKPWVKCPKCGVEVGPEKEDMEFHNRLSHADRANFGTKKATDKLDEFLTDEISGAKAYLDAAHSAGNSEISETLESMAADELEHAQTLQNMGKTQKAISKLDSFLGKSIIGLDMGKDQKLFYVERKKDGMYYVMDRTVGSRVNIVNAFRTEQEAKNLANQLNAKADESMKMRKYNTTPKRHMQKAAMKVSGNVEQIDDKYEGQILLNGKVAVTSVNFSDKQFAQKWVSMHLPEYEGQYGKTQKAISKLDSFLKAFRGNFDQMLDFAARELESGKSESQIVSDLMNKRDFQRADAEEIVRQAKNELASNKSQMRKATKTLPYFTVKVKVYLSGRKMTDTVKVQAKDKTQAKDLALDEVEESLRLSGVRADMLEVISVAGPFDKSVRKAFDGTSQQRWSGGQGEEFESRIEHRGDVHTASIYRDDKLVAGPKNFKGGDAAMELAEEWVDQMHRVFSKSIVQKKEQEWITVRGVHIPIKEGQSKLDAAKRNITTRSGSAKKPSSGGKTSESSEKKPKNTTRDNATNKPESVRNSAQWVGRHKEFEYNGHKIKLYPFDIHNNTPGGYDVKIDGKEIQELNGAYGDEEKIAAYIDSKEKKTKKSQIKKTTLSEIVSHVQNNARYFAQGIPPSRKKYAVKWKGKNYLSNDTGDLTEQIARVEGVPVNKMQKSVSKIDSFITKFFSKDGYSEMTPAGKARAIGIDAENKRLVEESRKILEQSQDAYKMHDVFMRLRSRLVYITSSAMPAHYDYSFADNAMEALLSKYRSKFIRLRDIRAKKEEEDAKNKRDKRDAKLNLIHIPMSKLKVGDMINAFGNTFDKVVRLAPHKSTQNKGGIDVYLQGKESPVLYYPSWTVDILKKSLT